MFSTCAGADSRYQVSAGGVWPTSATSDSVHFLREWLRNPTSTAALAPSSKALADLITSELDGSTGKVLELGPGTGSFTKRLLARGVKEEDLTLIELNPSFCDLLRRRFPKAELRCVDAGSLADGEDNGTHSFGAAICGLGLRSMGQVQVEAIVRSAFSLLQPGSALYLFTYGFRCSVPLSVLEKLNLASERIGTTLRNMPPASVYRLTTCSGLA
ncbi:phospholipid N-methyltransferase [Sphingobium sp. OAS761]|uniref:class I SAM-dependent methyltransferase n=1 Tax=Sphingobium sp. OAS761 TaxID=2817901 RepID=UPI00209D5DC0|nr:methyltransferase domain-containing protein [Sphingobium sp. OAS761]MCP1471859.1 phospholipid N-methyltransferase [Sphingobium sp. OAS761]